MQRDLFMYVVVAILAALAGCGGTGKGKSGDGPVSGTSPKSVAGPASVPTAAQARTQLLETAKKMEGPFWLSVKGFVEAVETG